MLLHAHKMQSAKHNKELDDLGNSHDRHQVYHKLLKLSPENFLHLKNAAREQMTGQPGFYHHFPSIVMFDAEDNPVLSALADDDINHHHCCRAVESDNIVGGSLWSKIKKVAKKARKIYSGVNGAVHELAKFAKSLPIPEKARVLVDALETGTALHSKLLGDGKVDQGPDPAVNAMV